MLTHYIGTMKIYSQIYDSGSLCSSTSLQCGCQVEVFAVFLSLWLWINLFSENFDVGISVNQSVIHLDWYTLFDKHPLNRKDSLLHIVSPAEHKVYQAHVTEEALCANFTSGSSFQAYLLYSIYKKVRKAHLFHGQIWAPKLGKLILALRLNCTISI